MNIRTRRGSNTQTAVSDDPLDSLVVASTNPVPSTLPVVEPIARIPERPPRDHDSSEPAFEPTPDADPLAQLLALWQAAPRDPWDFFKYLLDQGFTTSDTAQRLAQATGQPVQTISDTLTLMGAPAEFAGAAPWSLEDLNAHYLAALNAAALADGSPAFDPRRFTATYLA
jgi:hypothetical protein